MNNIHLYEKLINAIDEAETIVPCRDSDPELWFLGAAESGFVPKAAIELCNTCPVKDLCATYAIQANEEYGVWGGLTPRQRQQMRNATKRLRGRPRLAEVR